MANVVIGHGTESALIAARAFKKEWEQKCELLIMDQTYKKTFSYQVSHRTPRIVIR
jgi:hypothetical protein